MLAVATPAVRRTAAMRRCSWRPRQQPPHQPAGGSLHVRSLSSGRTSPALTPPPPPLRRPPAASKPEMTMVDRLLRQRILAHGPVSVSDFMQEVLTAPIGGYYTEATATDDQPATSAADVGVFGKRGDFVTAPEISQLFGELLGLWCIGLWQSAGSPKTVQLVELGPGRGKMMSDILRTSKHFPAFNGALSVSMVEASPTLIRSQAEVLGVENLSEFDASTRTADSKAALVSHEEAKERVSEEEGWVAEGATVSGVPVQWFRHFSTAVPASASPVVAGVSKEDDSLLIVLANEYWDALPARQFQLTERGWCEVCVDAADTDEDEASPYHLKWALSPHESPAVAAYVPFVLEGERQRLRELGQDPLQRGHAAAEDVASSVLPSPGSTIPGVDPTEPAGGINVAAERAKSAELMKRKLDVALREGVIDEEKYEKAKAMLEQQGVDISSDPANTEIGAGGVALPAAEGHQEVMERVEVCPAGLALVQEVTAVLQRRKGAALIIDYGADRTYSDSLQAVRGHQYHPVLSEPGKADVSCSVDFRSLRRAALALAVPETGSGTTKPVVVHGPLTQGELLMGLGIEARLSQLVSAAGGENTELGRSAIQGATRLVDSRTPSSMGRLFKALAITHADLPPPEPFGSPTKEPPE